MMNFKFDETGKTFRKHVENAVGKAEITNYQQFLLFLSLFKKLVLQTRKNQGFFGKGLNLVPDKDSTDSLIKIP